MEHMLGQGLLLLLLLLLLLVGGELRENRRRLRVVEIIVLLQSIQSHFVWVAALLLVGHLRRERSLRQRGNSEILSLGGECAAGCLRIQRRLLGHHLQLLHLLLVAVVRQLLQAWLVVNRLSALVNANQLLPNFEIVGLVCVLQRANVVEDIFDLLDILRLVGPQVLLGVIKTACFDRFDRLHGEVSILAPFQFLFEEIEDDKIVTPQVVPATQINIVVRVKTCETNGAAEVSLTPRSKWVLIVVEVLFCKSKVNNINFFEILREDEVGGLDVAVNESCVVHLLDRGQHLDQQLDGDLEAVI